MLSFSSLFALRQVRISFCDSGRCLWFPAAPWEELLAFVGVTQETGAGGREIELSGSEVFLLLILPLKGSRKENVDTFSYQLPHIKTVICLNGYREA